MALSGLLRVFGIRGLESRSCSACRAACLFVDMDSQEQLHRNEQAIGRALHYLNVLLRPFIQRRAWNEWGEQWLQHLPTGMETAGRRREDVYAHDGAGPTPFHSQGGGTVGSLETMDTRMLLKCCIVLKEVLLGDTESFERSLFYEVSRHRNAWAHQVAMTSNDTWRVLDSVHRLSLYLHDVLLSMRGDRREDEHERREAIEVIDRQRKRIILVVANFVKRERDRELEESRERDRAGARDREQGRSTFGRDEPSFWQGGTGVGFGSSGFPVAGSTSFGGEGGRFGAAPDAPSLSALASRLMPQGVLRESAEDGDVMDMDASEF